MSVVRIPYDIKKIKVPRGEVHIKKEYCKGCGFCIEYCPNDVLALSDEYFFRVLLLISLTRDSVELFRPMITPFDLV